MGGQEIVFDLLKTAEFKRWYEKQTIKVQVVIDARLQRIVFDGHFGTINKFDGLIELKWKSGLRVYTHRQDRKVLIILLGGNKNAQSYDIRKAKKILREIFGEA